MRGFGIIFVEVRTHPCVSTGVGFAHAAVDEPELISMEMVVPIQAQQPVIQE